MSPEQQIASHGGVQSELFVYLANDGTLWGLGQAGASYQLSSVQPGELVRYVEEAPNDGEPYVRRSMQWAPDKGTPGATVPSVTLANAGNQITLSIGEYGDLWVTQQSGPNAGKSTNLTYGKWA